MFGYIRPNVEELKVKEARLYRAYYCGLCHVLKDNWGTAGRLSLSYDMTFLSLLLSSLYEMEETIEKNRCPLHPIVKTDLIKNAATQYAAEMNILLTYEKCQDDFRDEGKKLRYFYGRHLGQKSLEMSKKYTEKIRVLERCLKILHDGEKRGYTDYEKMSEVFGRAFEEIFVYKEDLWERYLRKIGNGIGRFVYILDAFDDLESDREKGLYNPLYGICDKENYEKEVKAYLLKSITEAAKAFECLPIIRNAEILRNTIYSGVWSGMNRNKKGGDRCESLRDFGR